MSGRDRGESATGITVGCAGQFLERSPGHRGVGELFVACGGDEQRRPRRNAATHEGEQPEAHLVGPVQVLQHDHQGLPGGDLLDELGHALEQGQSPLARRWQAGRARFGSRRANSARRVGCRAPRISSSALTWPLRQASTQGPKGRIESLSWQRPIKTRQPWATASATRVLIEPRLADACLAHHRGDVPVPPDRLVEQPSQPP